MSDKTDTEKDNETLRWALGAGLLFGFLFGINFGLWLAQ